MSMHEIFDLEKYPEKKQKKSNKNKIASKLINNKKLIFALIIYILLSGIYTTVIILKQLFKLI